MEKKRNPKLDIEKGKKYKVILKDSFSGESPDKKKNDGSMRPWYGYNIIYNNTDYTTFVDKILYDELNRYSSGSVVEIIDTDESEAFYLHKWEVHAVGNTDTLDKQMTDSKNKTEIKIQVFASMKIASAISSNIDELKLNTHSVMALHKEICESIEDEKQVAELEDELF